MCLPKSAGGYNLLNLRVWNKEAITNIHEDLSQKKDKVWIRWIHTYYIKGQTIMDVTLPQHASWMARKIMEARTVIQQVATVKQRQSITKQVYLGLLQNYNKVAWRSLMFHNEARPKALFTMWIQCHGRLLTSDRLTRWGIQVSPKYSLCNSADKSHLHLFGECSFSKTVWWRLLRRLQMYDAPVNSWT